jgi:hypothetical protein
MTKNISIASMISKTELSAEIARIALACPTCKGHVRDAIICFENQSQNKKVNVNPVRGHSSLATTNESKDGLTNDYSTLEYK